MIVTVGSSPEAVTGGAAASRRRSELRRRLRVDEHGAAPLLSIVIPTHERPHLLPRALESACGQTIEDLEILVVDDGSREPPQVRSDSRVRVIRLPAPRGSNAARNVGLHAATGHFVSFLDDDDRILPHMAAVSLEALATTDCADPVAVISAIDVIDAAGGIVTKRIPPDRRDLGAHFALEPLETGRSYHTKQTLVVRRRVLLDIGGWDETFHARAHTELFLRLNPTCTIIGLPVVTYQLHQHTGYRLSHDNSLRREIRQLATKHASLVSTHRRRFTELLLENAGMAYRLGDRRSAFESWGWALLRDPMLMAQRVLARAAAHLRSKR